jgi:hypothetical protein
MKLMRILFQVALLLAIPIVVSQPLKADTTLHTDPLVAQAPPATHSTHRLARTIVAGFETGFMGDVVPLVALFLFGRAVWMLMPSKQMETESGSAPRFAWEKPVWIESQSMIGRGLASLSEFGRPAWRWMMTPQLETKVVWQKPHVDVPPLRSTPERITIF